VTSGQPASDKSYLNRALEISIHIGLIVLLAAACLIILSPFIAVVAWGVIIAIANYPKYCQLQKLLGGRGGFASILFTVLLLTILIVPATLLARTLIESFRALAVRVQSGTLTIPPPPSNIATWPIFGKPLSDLWSLASSISLPPFRRSLRNSNRLRPGLSAAGVGLGVLQFFVAILIAGFLLASRASVRGLRKLAIHLFSNRPRV
jgi:predicted PurR-regulated permease PerM